VETSKIFIFQNVKKQEYSLPYTLNKLKSAYIIAAVLRIRDPVPALGSGMGKIFKIRIRMSIPDHNSESLETIFWVKNTSNSFMWIRVRNLFDPGYGTWDGKFRIRDKHPGSATLHCSTRECLSYVHNTYSSVDM
jgi:hypothetical protein